MAAYHVRISVKVGKLLVLDHALKAIERKKTEEEAGQRKIFNLRTHGGERKKIINRNKASPGQSESKSTQQMKTCVLVF